MKSRMLRHLLPAGRLKMRYALSHESGKPTWEQRFATGASDSLRFGGKILSGGARHLRASTNRPYRAATKLDRAIASGEFDPDTKAIGQAIKSFGKGLIKKKPTTKEQFNASDASIRYRRNRRLNRR